MYGNKVNDKTKIHPIKDLTLSIDNEGNKAYRGENVSLSGTLIDSSGTPLENQTLGININSIFLYATTNEVGSFTANYPLVSNYNLGISNASVVFNETDWYLGNYQNNSFFVFGKNAHASGIGEKLIEEKKHIDRKYLLLFPHIHSSTRELFLKWDKLSKASQKSINLNEENSFLPIFLDEHKEIKEIFNELNKINSFKLSGTGSTIFCVYNDLKEIEKTMKKIPPKWRHSFCEPLQCSPLLTLIE